MTKATCQSTGAPFNNQPFAQRIEKPWGHEIVFTPPAAHYAGKLLYILAGCRLSLQYHDEKYETILLVRGRAQLQVETASGVLETVEMENGKGYSILPGQRHRLIAIDDCELVEASTPECGTTFRAEDDAGRGDETEAMRNQPNRGWSGA